MAEFCVAILHNHERGDDPLHIVLAEVIDIRLGRFEKLRRRTVEFIKTVDDG